MSHGEVLQVPMPGHPPGQGQREAVLSAVATLTRLVQGHDVIFLLTDSRESRWLPSLLGAAHNKVSIKLFVLLDTIIFYKGFVMELNVQRCNTGRKNGSVHGSSISYEAGYRYVHMHVNKYTVN